MAKYDWSDVVERVLWTAAQAGLGYLAVEFTDSGAEWAVAVATGAALLKNWVAKKLTGTPAVPTQAR